MIRAGLCCAFVEEPIRFRVATAARLRPLPRREQLEKLSRLCLGNAGALEEALRFCAREGIGAFRVNSRILPLYTHPEVGYEIDGLPDADRIVAGFRGCGELARRLDIRLTFHPDQFVLLSSPSAEVTRLSIAELAYQAMVAEWIGADVITIHLGGSYGNAEQALERFASTITSLPEAVVTRLGLENDDRLYPPADVLRVCAALGLPFVYDVHHHRCLGDGMSVAEATMAALRSWGGREPVFHISSPRAGWGSPTARQHHDYIAVEDIPREWLAVDATVAVEAKAKECALRRFLADVAAMGGALWGRAAPGADGIAERDNGPPGRESAIRRTRLPNRPPDDRVRHRNNAPRRTGG
ncbi:MAG: UV DNA damage repair endonuclease UvsE [Lentisphaeria bacterium]|nr:UV DNA damage repair endonuclease UvsE [Lentisphaeria bacterium]